MSMCCRLASSEEALSSAVAAAALLLQKRQCVVDWKASSRSSSCPSSPESVAGDEDLTLGDLVEVAFSEAELALSLSLDFEDDASAFCTSSLKTSLVIDGNDATRRLRLYTLNFNG